MYPLGPSAPERNFEVSRVTPEAGTRLACVLNHYQDLNSSYHLGWVCSVRMKGIGIQTHYGRGRVRGYPISSGYQRVTSAPAPPPSGIPKLDPTPNKPEYARSTKI
eukprot:6210925-Pleurochrysis_carterae.AAC.1